jgi:vacuolar-type H+-ATPase subunit E/Vma4
MGKEKEQQAELNRLREELNQIKSDVSKLVLANGIEPKKELTIEAIEAGFLQAKKDLEKLKCSVMSSKAIELRGQRLRFNEAIIKKLTEYVYTHPDVRFGQALSNLDLENTPFNEESYDTYMRVFIR